MTDKEMKLEHFKEENKNAVKGQIVLTGSSLMEMFPVNKFLAEYTISSYPIAIYVELLVFTTLISNNFLIFRDNCFW